MVWKVILIIYGILCLYVGLLKPPFIWRTKKFEVLTKALGQTGTVILCLVFGAAALSIGIWVIQA